MPSANHRISGGLPDKNLNLQQGLAQDNAADGSRLAGWPKGRGAHMFVRRGRRVRDSGVMPVGTSARSGRALRGARSAELDASIFSVTPSPLRDRRGKSWRSAASTLHRLGARSPDRRAAFSLRLGALRKISEEGFSFARTSTESRASSRRKCRWRCRRRSSPTRVAFDECAPAKLRRRGSPCVGVDGRWLSVLASVENCSAPSRTRFASLSGAQTGGLSVHQALFGIIQGASHSDLRARVWSALLDGFDGYAIAFHVG